VFNGIIRNLASLESKQSQKDHTKSTTTFVFRCPAIAKESQLGDSIAVNGVCLTVVSKTSENLSFDVLDESLSRTNLGLLKTGDTVNLEQSLRLNDYICGHLVSGHVDFCARLLEVNADKWTFELNPDYSHLLASKGSITLNGVALTSCELDDDSFSVYLIPETLERTNLKDLKPGDMVNVEIDMIARYVERLINHTK